MTTSSNDGAAQAAKFPAPNDAGVTGNKIGRFGYATYARMLSLVKEPASIAHVVEKTGAKRQSVREILWRMERLGLVHVADWQEPTGRSSYMEPLFVIGEGGSAPYPRTVRRAPIGSTRGRPRSELIAFAAIVRLLRQGATRNDLFEQTGVAYMRVSNLLREMRRLGLVHTSDWRCRDDGTGRPAEVLSLGAGKNAPRLRTISRAEIQRASRQRRRARAGMVAMIQMTAANMPMAREAA